MFIRYLSVMSCIRLILASETSRIGLVSLTYCARMSLSDFVFLLLTRHYEFEFPFAASGAYLSPILAPYDTRILFLLGHSTDCRRSLILFLYSCAMREMRSSLRPRAVFSSLPACSLMSPMDFALGSLFLTRLMLLSVAQPHIGSA